MPMVDPFTPSAFSLTQLTLAINNLPYQPRRLGQLGLFEEQGISTLSAAIDEQDGVLSLVDVKPRGAPGKPVREGARRAIPFIIPHLPQMANIMADEVQGVRMFGSDNQAEVLQTKINERLQSMRNNIDLTMEVHRAKAVKGTYTDNNGDDVSLFTTFNVAQQTKAMDLKVAAGSNIRGKMFDVRKMVRLGLGGLSWTGLHVLCGDDFWSELISDGDVQATYLNQAQAAELRGNPTDSFTAFGATWEWYEGTTDATLGSDAYVIPMGVPGLFITRFAPANYNETVNTLGLPYYAKGEPMDFGKGYSMESQSNPLNLCTRPRAIIKLTKDT